MTGHLKLSSHPPPSSCSALQTRCSTFRTNNHTKQF